jgi:hypothetical protein
MPANREYKDSIFIAKVRECKAGTGDNAKAMKMAIQYCIENNILKKFLEANASEVLNMLLTEWNTIEYGEVQREEGRDMVLGLLDQGYTPEQIRARLEAARTAETAGE